MNDELRPYHLMALNNAWANATFYRAVERLTSEDFQAERPGFFPSLCRTLNHIYEVDLYYVDALDGGGRGYGVFDRQDVTHAIELGALQADVDMRLAMFCKGLTPDDLSGNRVTDRPGGMISERVDALLLHLFQHQIHHRGQAHVQLQHAGLAPPQLDEFYLEFDRAGTAEVYFE